MFEPTNGSPDTSINRSPSINLVKRVSRVSSALTNGSPRKIHFKHKGSTIESFRGGYPRLAAFVSSDREFGIFRSFSRAHARVLLCKQDEIIELQDQLDELDKNETKVYFLHTRRQDRNNQRREIVVKLEKLLVEYNTLLEGYYRHLERRRPRKEHVESVSKWLRGNQPLVAAESTLFDDWEDLTAPDIPSDHGGLEQFLERCAVYLNRTRFRWIFMTKIDRAKTSDQNVVHYSPERIALFSRMITAILAIGMLTIPIAALYCIKKTPSRLGAIAAFTTIFASALCITRTRNFEIFSATAAYCAVMVVFVANLPG